VPTQVLELLRDALVVDRGLAPLDLEALVLAQRRLGPHADLDREAERLALLGELAEVESRLADRVDARDVDRLGVPVADRAPDRLIEDVRPTDAADHDLGRDLPLPEARHAHVAAELLRGANEALLDLVGGHLRLDADARLGELGDVRLEGCRHEAPNDTVGP
jgi:hypothetical protein